MTTKNIQKHKKNSLYYLFVLLIFLLSILFINTIVSALSPLDSIVEEKSMMIEPEPGYYPDYRVPAQNSQYYSVIFDEEGEAVVALKVNVNNVNNQTLDQLKIEIPGQSVRILNIVQEYHLLKEECAEWKEVCADDNCTSYYKKCAYYDSYVDKYDAKYYPVEYTSEKLSDSSMFTFTLPKVITQQNTATLIIYYKATGYVKKSLGVHEFDFETTKYNYDSSRVRVSINVQNDLFLQGVSSNVDYKPADFGMLADASIAKSESIDSKQLSEYSRSIEYDYGFVKEASALDSWESFHVKGKYSGSKLMLNKGKISLTIGIILGVLALLFFGVRKAYKALKNYSVVSDLKTKAKAIIPQTPPHQSLVIILVTSFISSILLLLGWFALTFVSGNLYSWVGYGYSGGLTLLLVLVFFCYTLFVLLAPPIYVGIRLGILHGFATFGAIVGFLVLEIIILVVIFASITSRVYY